MKKITHTNRLLSLVKEKGLLRPYDLEALNIPRVYLTRLIRSAQLEKVGHGLYKIPEDSLSEYESLTIVAAKVPQAVFCLLTALQFHELTTQLPRKIWIAMPRGSHTPRLTHPPLKMIQYSEDSHSEGIEIFLYDEIELKVYGIEKTIADCFKHRNKIGVDVALEALKGARERNKIDIDELWHHAKICRVTNIMRPYLEAING